MMKSVLVGLGNILAAVVVAFSLLYAYSIKIETELKNT